MFGLNDGMRYYVCQRYVRMNMGINGLYKLVLQEMDLPPLSGAVFACRLKFICKLICNLAMIRISECYSDILRKIADCSRKLKTLI